MMDDDEKRCGEIIKNKHMWPPSHTHVVRDTCRRWVSYIYSVNRKAPAVSGYCVWNHHGRGNPLYVYRYNLSELSVKTRSGFTTVFDDTCIRTTNVETPTKNYLRIVGWCSSAFVDSRKTIFFFFIINN